MQAFVIRNESRGVHPTNEVRHRRATSARVAVTALAACGGILMLLALPLSVFPTAQVAYLRLAYPSRGPPITNPRGLDPIQVTLLASILLGFAGVFSLALAGEAFRSRLDSGTGLVILALIAFVSVSMVYAGLFGTLAGVLLLTAGIVAFES